MREPQAVLPGLSLSSWTQLISPAAQRLVADTLEADWNTALRALNDAQGAYDKAREQHDGTSYPAAASGC